MNFFDDESKIIEWLQSVKVNKVLLLNDSVAVREIFASNLIIGSGIIRL